MENKRADPEGESHSRCQPVIPVRLVVTFFLFTGMALSYMMRVNMSIAVVSMVNMSEHTATYTSNDASTCAELLHDMGNQTSKQHEQIIQRGGTFNWDVRTQSVILGSFFYGWTVATFPGSIIVQRLGAKWSFGLSVFFCAICTLFTPFAADRGVGSLIAVRVIGGAVQSITSPARNVLLAYWTPEEEKGRAVSFVISGIDAGVVVGMLLSGVLADSNIMGGWPSIFYVFGILGIIWFLLWTILIYEDPTVHPRISEAELKIIQRGRQDTGKMNLSVPWKSISTSVPMWSVVIACFGEFWGFCMLMTELPTYLANIMHYNIKTNGFLSALPYAIRVASGFICGQAVDCFVKVGKLSTSTVRKISISIGLFVPGICMLIITYIGCHPTVIIALLCVSMFFNVLAFAGCQLVIIDLSPTYTGILTSICYTFASATGFLTPFVAGEFTSNGQTLENWGYVFMTTAGVMFFSGLIFDVFGTAEVQSWSSPVSKEPSTPKKKEIDVSFPERFKQIPDLITSEKSEITKF